MEPGRGKGLREERKRRRERISKEPRKSGEERKEEGEREDPPEEWSSEAKEGRNGPGERD